MTRQYWLPYSATTFYTMMPQYAHTREPLLCEYAYGRIYRLARTQQEAQNILSHAVEDGAWEHPLRQQLVQKHQKVLKWNFEQSDDLHVTCCEWLVGRYKSLQDSDLKAGLSAEEILVRAQNLLRTTLHDRFWIIDVAQESLQSPQRDLL